MDGATRSPTRIRRCRQVAETDSIELVHKFGRRAPALYGAVTLKQSRTGISSQRPMPGPTIPISRRTLLKFGAASLVASGTAVQADAQMVRALSRDELLGLLSNAAWIADGPPNDSQIFVIGTPWCPYCKAFYEQLRAFPAAAQYRWIMSGSRDTRSEFQNELAAGTRDSALLAQMYRGAVPSVVPPNDSKWLAAWNEGVSASIAPTVNQVAGRYATPAIFWISKRLNYGVSIISGLPDGPNLKNLLADIVPTPAARDYTPESIRLMAGRVVEDRHIGPVGLFSPDVELPLVAAPESHAPMIGLIRPRQGFNADMVAVTRQGERWAGFPFLKSGNIDIRSWAPLSQLTMADGQRADVI